ncbi:hypothetical protein ES706_03757 [subsurface metagenome]
MKTRNRSLKGSVVLAVFVCLVCVGVFSVVLSLDLDGDNLTVFEEISIRGARILTNDIPEHYYPASECQSTPDLERFVSGLVLPREIEADVFDCSESSAFVEWALEGAGFDARIATGHAFRGPSEVNHAWVIVYTTDGSRVAIEATNLTIVHGDIPGICAYYHPEFEYSDIYEAIRDTKNLDDWDWWQAFSEANP